METGRREDVMKRETQVNVKEIVITQMTVFW
jgi:hypothetical protein